MRALEVDRPRPAEAGPLRLVERPVPEPAADELLVRVEVCGVCRTDLHVAEGDLAPRRARVVPGHEVVGHVVERGAAVRDGPAEGARVGVAWLHRACGACRFCAREAENLCVAPIFTGWDVDGGYADYLVVPAAFAHPLPEGPDAAEMAPLLCAGIIGYRAYVRSGVPPGEPLGLYGFGGSAHIVLQLARHLGHPVYVVSRGEAHRSLARELGATWVGDSGDVPPTPLRAAIVFAPAGEVVPEALGAVDRGGVVAVAGIHLSAIPSLDYERHLFQERELRSVTANTRADARELLRLALEIPVATHIQRFPLEDAGRALVDLKQGRVRGAAVLEVGG